MWQRSALTLFLAVVAVAPAAAQSDPIEALNWQSQRLAYEIPGSKSTYKSVRMSGSSSGSRPANFSS